MTANFASGFVYGTGAALNVECGFIPDFVIVTDQAPTVVINVGAPAIKTMAFTSGSTEIKAGHWIVGATSGARARVRQALTDTGTWAGGDAAGSLILDTEGLTGTFASEAIYIEGEATLDDATGAAVANFGVDIDTEVAADTGISGYTGSEASAAKGFTLATAVSTDAKLLHWAAFRNA